MHHEWTDTEWASVEVSAPPFINCVTMDTFLIFLHISLKMGIIAVSSRVILHKKKNNPRKNVLHRPQHIILSWNQQSNGITKKSLQESLPTTEAAAIKQTISRF